MTKSHMGFRDECVKFKRQPAAQAPHLLQIGKPEIHVRFNVLPTGDRVLFIRWFPKFTPSYLCI